MSCPGGSAFVARSQVLVLLVLYEPRTNTLLIPGWRILASELPLLFGLWAVNVIERDVQGAH